MRVQNPTTIHRDHYRAWGASFAVHDTRAGLEGQACACFRRRARPTSCRRGEDGSVYLAGPNLYKGDVNTGAMTVAPPIRDRQRSTHAPLDVLYICRWQTPTRDFTILYTTAKYQGRQAGHGDRRVPVMAIWNQNSEERRDRGTRVRTADRDLSPGCVRRRTANQSTACCTA